MNTKEQFLNSLINPLPAAVLKLYPAGNIMQYWSDNPGLYAGSLYNKSDDFSRYVSGHTGVDIATKHRDKVVSAHKGRVSGLKKTREGIGGLTVYIESDVLADGKDKVKFISAYGHLDEISVRIGDEVNAGDPIGLEGNTGFVVSGGTAYWGNAPAGVGTHLHFGIYEYIIKDGRQIERWKNGLQSSFDPLPFITGDQSGNIIALNNLAALLKHWIKTKFIK